jgi:hypothetical protein
MRSGSEKGAGVTGEEWALAASVFFSGLASGLLGMLTTIMHPMLKAMDGRDFRNFMEVFLRESGLPIRQEDRERPVAAEVLAECLAGLRHRRITIWHQSGVPARELAERAGHARASMSLDVYSHVMPPDEVSAERSVSFLRGAGRTT